MARKFELMKFPKEGVEVQSYVETDGSHKGQFTARYANDVFRDPVYSVLKEQVSKAVSESVKLQWIPIIEVSADGQTGHAQWDAGKSTAELTYDRYWIAKRDNAEWAKCRWGVDEKERLAHSSQLCVWDHSGGYNKRELVTTFDTLPIAVCKQEQYGPHARQQMVYYLPYTEKMWAGIGLLAQQLITLGTKLQEIMGTPEGRGRVEDRGIRLLGGGA